MLSLQIKGLDAKLKFFDKFPKELEEQVGKEIKTWSAMTTRDAIAKAPSNEGNLRASIFADYSNLTGRVVVKADYAAYVEFGTRKFAEAYVASLPATWKEFAATYKGGGGGSFEELVKNITEWIHHKGLGSGFFGTIGVTGTYSLKTRKRTGSKSSQETQDKQVAYLIARKIVRFGIKAQPFLYPADRDNKLILIENLKKITGAKYIKIA
jgi:hypothetical protein